MELRAHTGSDSDLDDESERLQGLLEACDIDALVAYLEDATQCSVGVQARHLALSSIDFDGASLTVTAVERRDCSEGT